MTQKHRFPAARLRGSFRHRFFRSLKSCPLQKGNMMTLLLVLSGSICLISLFFYLRLLGDIRSLSRQLDEINAGSQIELTVFTRQKTFLALCRRVNRVLSSKDQSHARYEQAEKLLKRNITNLAHDIRTPRSLRLSAAGKGMRGRLPERPLSFICRAETDRNGRNAGRTVPVHQAHQ